MTSVRRTAIPREMVSLLASTREVFTPHDLQTAAKLFGYPETEMIAAAWDMVEDGELTYNARAEFKRVRP